MSSAGAGAHDGTSEANAFTVAEMVTDVNTPRVGYRYNIIQDAGYTSLATITITGDGTTTSPNIFRGYKTTIGDATLGRNSLGFIDDSNMPHLQFASSAYFNASGANYAIIEGIKFTGSNNARIVRIANTSQVCNCSVTNNSAGSSALGIEGESADCLVINNDVFLPSLTGTTGSGGISSAGVVQANRVTLASSAGSGIIIAASVYPCFNNLVIGGYYGIYKNATAIRTFIEQNTIVGASQSGIEVITASTAQIVIIGNHITGCGTYGINFNTSTCAKVLSNNRFRNNGTDVNGGGDWETGTSWRNVTTAGSDSTDFTDSASGDYSLKSTAPGYDASIGHYVNIGGCGTPAGSGGGGSALHLGSLGQTGIGAF